MINHVSRKLWDEITYPFSNFNGCTVEVWEWISNFIPYFISVVITYPCWEPLPTNERGRTSHVVECSVDVNRDISVCVSISVPGPRPTLGAKSSLASCQSSGWSVIWLAESCHSVCRKRTSLNSFADIVWSLGVCLVKRQIKRSFQYPIKHLVVSQSLEAARFVFIIFCLLCTLTGDSTARLSRGPTNCKAIWWFKVPILGLRGFTRSSDKFVLCHTWS